MRDLKGSRGQRGGEAAPASDSTTLSIRVLPRSSRNEVAGMADGAIRIRLTAPPVENRANESLARFLSRALGVPRSHVDIVAGGSGRRKIVRVRGAERAEVFRKLGLEQPPD